MKRTNFLVIALIALGAVNGAKAQVTIGDNAAPTVTLEVKGKPAETAKADGIIIPKLTGNQLKAKWDAGSYPQNLDANKSEGILVYITAACSPPAAASTPFEYVTAPGFYFFSLDGNAWKPLVSGGETHEAAPYAEPWNIAGTTNPATSNTQSIYQSASVGIGSSRPAASLDISAAANDTAGLLVPRLTLAELNARKQFYTTRQKGALVYITDASVSPVTGYSDQISCTGFVYWDGYKWISDCGVEATWIRAAVQPKAFTFYETGLESEVPLTFAVSTNGTNLKYTWYKVTGSNIHVRIGVKCTDSDGSGYNTASFTPNVTKGTTIDAANTGFYKFYCVAKVDELSNDSIVSNIAEVAVGCGAKNLQGEWLSFLCFNLGARTLTIADQMNYSITPVNTSVGYHYYVANEEYLYGDLYQWGRIGDGHEKRVGTPGEITPPSNRAPFTGITSTCYEYGNLIGTNITTHFPFYQIRRDSTTWYGKFIYSATTLNWADSVPTMYRDGLWVTNRSATNDPCTKIKSTYTGEDPFTPANVGIVGAQTNDWFSWYPVAQDADAAGDGSGNTGWRLPAQDEWASLYRGGYTSGNPSIAIANTWVWNSSNGNGYEIRPDNITTTLFLPAAGHRDTGSAGALFNQGKNALYWSSSVVSNSTAYRLNLNSGLVNPAQGTSRSTGMSVRCIKN
ncbi:MAG: hypothetical protein LBR64_05900 [Dysgonamonadaceae bacterium]|jgi:uncharacterized protein (TIGR02145 family)|nr:hypothetical protein [Dysgonamonadaceae bacterium]